MHANRHVMYLIAAIIFAVLALAAFMVVWLGPGDPAAIAAVFVALGALLGGVAQIVNALRTGDGNG